MDEEKGGKEREDSQKQTQMQIIKVTAKFTRSVLKWERSMVPTSMAGMKKLWLKSLHVLSNVKVFAKQEEWTDRLTDNTAGQPTG